MDESHVEIPLDNRLWFGLEQKSDTLHDLEQDLSRERLNGILENMEDYMKPIAPLFTFPDFRYQHVISIESSQGQPASRHQVIGSCQQKELETVAHGLQIPQ